MACPAQVKVCLHSSSETCFIAAGGRAMKGSIHTRVITLVFPHHSRTPRLRPLTTASGSGGMIPNPRRKRHSRNHRERRDRWPHALEERERRPQALEKRKLYFFFLPSLLHHILLKHKHLIILPTHPHTIYNSIKLGENKSEHKRNWGRINQKESAMESERGELGYDALDASALQRE
ncbi:hypothetical protein YC2023_012318 [Brassica napus]